MKVGRYLQAIGTTQQISFRGLLRSEATDLPEAHLSQLCFQVSGSEETQPRFTNCRGSSSQGRDQGALFSGERRGRHDELKNDLTSGRGQASYLPQGAQDCRRG